MTDFTERFCDRLKDALGSQSARSLAEKSGLSPTVVTKYINGESTPNIERLVAIAEALGVSLEWLATGAGPKTYGESDCCKSTEQPKATKRMTITTVIEWESGDE